MMTRILCLEDDPKSADIIERIIRDSFPPDALIFTRITTVGEAKKCVQNLRYDVAIIDIQVPLRAGEQPKADGGILLLDHILTSPHANRPRYIVGVTAEKELFEQAQPRFLESMFTLLQRDGSDTAWISQLSRFLSYVATQAIQDSRVGSSDQGEQPSLAIVCALPETELNAVVRWIDAGWKELRLSGDPNSYQSGRISTPSGDHRVIAAASQEPGMAIAASLTTKMIVQFRPRIVAMVGIAAGLNSEIGFGDIVIADQTWDYTTGKATDGGVLAETRMVKCDPTMLDQARALSKNRELLASIYGKWPGPKPNTQLRAHIGPVASGGAVIETDRVIGEIRSRDRKTIALDMEAYGVAAAGWYTTSPSTNVLVLKSVVDYGIPPKTDQWHQFAAYTSARFLGEWAARYL